MHRTYGVYALGINHAIMLQMCAAILALASGCSSGPRTYGIKGDGDPVLNRDINGKSLSVVVRLYQLRDSQEFSKLTFDSLADGRPEAELLGPALIDKTDVVIVPGGTYANTEKLHEDAKFLGIVAFFRRPDQFYWRQLVAADAVRSQGLNFRVQDCFVVLNGVKPIPIPGQPANARPECATANATPVRQSARPAAVAGQVQRQQPQRYQQPQQYPQAQQYQQGAAPANAGQKSSWLPQGIPDVTVNANTPVAPANVRIGRGGVNSVTVGEQPPAYPAQPAPAQPYYGQPYPAQQYPTQPTYDAPRY